MVLIFSITGFTSAFLLFLVQPMMGKLLLPHLGGAPAVWNTAMVFFQSLLLLGYLFAHLSFRLLDTRRQALLLIVLMALALLALPVGGAGDLSAPVRDNPVGWLLGVLVMIVGVPFFVLSAIAPMLQSWFASTEHRLASNPYFLYAASNLGSLASLVAYPVWIESRFGLKEQISGWGWGFALLQVLLAICALTMTLRYREIPEPADDAPDAERVTARRRVHWVLLAFAPSSLLLGVTSHLTTNIAPVPFLWLLPLALYLLTFVIAFSTWLALPLRILSGLHYGVIVLMVTVGALDSPFRWVHFNLMSSSKTYLLHLIAFFACALLCHARLANDRPHPRFLTEFYFWLSFGGLLGGVFNALVAPLLFNDVLEYPIALVLACALRPTTRASGKAPALPGLSGNAPALPGLSSRKHWIGDAALPALLVMVLLGIRIGYRDRWFGVETTWELEDWRAVATLALYTTTFLAAAALSFWRPVRFSLCVSAALLASVISFTDLSTAGNIQTETLSKVRNFYGVLTAEQLTPRGDDQLPVRRLVHGVTNHGSQFTDPRYENVPLTYYHPAGPLGDIFQSLSKAGDDPIAVIGLGIGTIACYGRPGQIVDFFELNPAVARMAADPELFTYLDICPARTRVIMGDGRISIAKSEPGQYGLIVVDAFSSDAIPTHLLTLEALRIYLDRLKPEGVIAFHISNGYVDLRPVLGTLAQAAELTAVARATTRSPSELRLMESNSIWVAMAAQPEELQRLLDHPDWSRLQPRPGLRVWTDDYTDVFSVLEF
jgi:spermidine synthase